MNKHKNKLISVVENLSHLYFLFSRKLLLNLIYYINCINVIQKFYNNTDNLEEGTFSSKIVINDSYTILYNIQLQVIQLHTMNYTICIIYKPSLVSL